MTESLRPYSPDAADLKVAAIRRAVAGILSASNSLASTGNERGLDIILAKLTDHEVSAVVAAAEGEPGKAA